MPTRTETNRRYEVTVRRDVRIPTRSPGLTLSADLFLPVAAGPVPVLVTALPYRRDIAALTGSPTEHWFAARGYASVLVDLAGTGSSDGVQRPPFDPSDADDAVDAITWAAAQPWCTGSVGMWGGSYGAMMTMRTAARKPAALDAIIAIEGFADPGRDFHHPGGSRGAFSPLGIWGLGTLFNQLLPPMDGFPDPAEQARWRRRLTFPPYLLDLFRNGPGAAAWSDRRVDTSRIEVPALCVAGWRDLFADAMIRAYERMTGYKRLIAGPWMHVMPHECPFTPIDFLELARSWWDRWLSPEPPPPANDHPVSIRVQGDRPRWLGFDTWPPEGSAWTQELDSWLRTEPAEPDPITGPRSGLWSTPAGLFGLPLDQHDDDAASLCYTSPPLKEPVLISGRPIVELTRPWPRVSVKLADVDPADRSVLISAGLETTTWEHTGELRIPLTPTTYELAAGHRLRVVVSPGDFPRVWPQAPPSGVWPVVRRLSLPVVSGQGEEIDFPAPEPGEGELAELKDRADDQPVFWDITEDLVHESVSVRVASGTEIRPDDLPGRELGMVVDQEFTATAYRLDPAESTVSGRIEGTIDLPSGEQISVAVKVVATSTSLEASGEVVVDGEVLLDRRWHG